MRIPQSRAHLVEAFPTVTSVVRVPLSSGLLQQGLRRAAQRS
jgi:hypothetical protein